MRYDYEVSLISQTYVEDEIGNQIPNETETVVLCSLKSVSRSEFYNAAATGLKPAMVFVIHGYEYNGEQLVKFEGEKYNVIRTYKVNFEDLELTCERVVGSG